MKNVLVTGGAGFIGSHAAKALAGAGYRPVTIDNLSTGHAVAVKWGPLHEHDIRDAAALDGLFAAYRPVAVMHFAALSTVGESLTRPTVYYDNNVSGTIALLEAMRRAGCRHIVFSSTCATYGIPDHLPITEETPQAPINPYGRSKLMIEHILRDCDTAHGLRSASLRYFNAAGADPDGEIGEDHDPETHLIPIALQATLGLRPRLEIYGRDYPTPDGTCIRDYIHVSDLAQAHVLALERLLEGGESHALNLGSGTGFSVLEIVSAIARIAGRPVPHVFTARRPGDPARLVAGDGRARSELGWRPRLSAIDRQIGDALQWIARSAAPPQEGTAASAPAHSGGRPGATRSRV